MTRFCFHHFEIIWGNSQIRCLFFFFLSSKCNVFLFFHFLPELSLASTSCKWSSLEAKRRSVITHWAEKQQQRQQLLPRASTHGVTATLWRARRQPPYRGLQPCRAAKVGQLQRHCCLFRFLFPRTRICFLYQHWYDHRLISEVSHVDQFLIKALNSNIIIIIVIITGVWRNMNQINTQSIEMNIKMTFPTTSWTTFILTSCVCTWYESCFLNI